MTTPLDPDAAFAGRREREGVSSHGEIRFAPQHRPLRRDVARLGALLGELLRELAPPGVYETVERARLVARAPARRPAPAARRRRCD